MSTELSTRAHRLTAVVAVGILGLSSGLAVADDGPEASPAAPPPARAETPLTDSATSDLAAAEPADLRGRLEAAGIKAEASWYGEWTRTLSGGLRPRNTTRRTFLDIDLTLSTEPLFGHPGGTFRFEMWRIGGDGRPDGSGANQDPSSLTSERRFELGQIWYEQALDAPRLRVRVGKFDPTYDFAQVERGWDNLNTAVSYPSNLTGVPVYPDTAFGAELFWDASETTQIALGVFDGALQDGVETGRKGPATLFGSPADLCMMAEVRRRWTAGEDHLPGTAAIGGWHHTGTFDRLDGTREDGTGGAYLVIEQQVLRESSAGSVGEPVSDSSGDPSDDSGDDQGLFLFGRTTVAERDVAEVGRHDGVGLLWTGLFDGRDEDITGLAFLRVDPSRATGSSGRNRAETVVELFHKFQVTTSISITPDVQYVRRPWGAPDAADALVVAVRFVMVF